MKKPSLKKLIALLAAAMLCLTATGMHAFAAQPENNVAAPYNIAITLMSNNLELGSNNTLICYGGTDVRNGYNAGVVVELQYHNGSKWETIRTWSDMGADWAVVDEEHTVSTGYYYRLYLTHRAYTSSWSTVETFYKTSNVIDLT
ncbi:MAG: hypothetical protein IKW59_02595 [Clostridia bacterium]|nr:hypothetical protein [Clostridia bacterium]